MAGQKNVSRVDYRELETFAHDVLTAAGVTEPHAATVAEALVRANLRGVDSHGVARLTAYVNKFREGGFKPDPEMTIESGPSRGTFSVDGDGGPGQTAGQTAMQTAIERAAEMGMAAGVVRNSNHFGTAAFYTELAAEHDCIGIAMTNVGPDVVPFNGTKPYFGTNPISFAIPTHRSYPITLDMATSVVAMGKIDHVAKETDASIPDHWGVDDDGVPTTDPHEVNALRPLGGPKGYGLALVVDILAGVLSGSGPSPTVNPLYDEYDRPMDLGHFVAAVDISAFRDTTEFKDDVDTIISDIKAMEPRDDAEELMLPGEIETKRKETRSSDGIPVPNSVVESLQELGDDFGVQLPR
ncbi:Ldh family oxidoreductase [Natrialba swarupiae]|nr:Ldh family oxidoreductase [Natrialba swarupiae]